MKLTRRLGHLGSGRGRLSLRSRLLAGLITVTALFLIVMGVVTTLVLGHSEQDQFNSDLVLTARVKVSDLAGLTSGYGVAYYNPPTRSVGTVGTPSPAAAEVQGLLDRLLASRQATGYFIQHPAGQLFGISQSGQPALTAIWRWVTAGETSHSNGLLPSVSAGGRNLVVIARPDSAVGSEVRGLV